MTGSRVQQAPAGIGVAMLVSERPAVKGSMALSLCRSNSIDYETFQKILSEHPRTAAIIRKNVMKDVVREGVRHHLHGTCHMGVCALLMTSVSTGRSPLHMHAPLWSW